MAYGMLTSALLGAGTGLVKFGMDKVARSMEEEAKLKAEMEREARIEEATKRSEERAMSREQSIYERNQADKTLETGANRQFEIDKLNLQEKNRKADEEDKRAYENDPNTLAGQAKIEALNAAKTTNASQRLELETKSEVLKAGSEWENAKTDEERRAAENKIKALTGKVGDTVEFKTSTDIIGHDKNDKPITKTTMNWVDTRNRTVTPVEGTSTAPLTDKKLREEANAKANAAGGTDYKGYQDIKPSKWYGGDSEEEIKKKEEFNKVYTETLANGGKAPTGMLGAKTSTPTSPAPFKADDPARQKEYDIIFGGVVKQHESGNKGVNAQNPTSSAGGTWQLTDPTAEFYKAKKDANGKISNAEKDRVAPEFYKDVYRNTNGDPAAMIASGFAPNDVKSAMKDAVKKGTKWWQETDSITPKDMEESYVRARESVARLQSVGIEPDARLLDFVDNYKATKIASATPDKSAFKLKAVRPAL
jgi:signal peptidase I